MRAWLRKRLEFFADVAAFGEQRGFLRERGRARAPTPPNNSFSLASQPSRKRRAQSFRQHAHLIGFAFDFRQAFLQLVDQVRAFCAAHLVELSQRLPQAVFQRASELFHALFILRRRDPQPTDHAG